MEPVNRLVFQSSVKAMNNRNRTLFRLATVLLLLLMMLTLVQVNTDSILSTGIFGLGILLGASLNYFQFGFSSSFRHLLLNRQTLAVRAIIWMLALSLVLFAVLFQITADSDQPLQGFVRPLSLAVIIGAFIFGIGMQIGCGCTSGTLNRIGQLQIIALPTMVFMVIGGTLAAWSFESWRHLPALAPFNFYQQFDFALGLFLQLLLLWFIYRFLLWLEKRQHQTVEPLFVFKNTVSIHPWLQAGFALALLNAALLWFSGSPWSIASIFPYWGVHSADLLNLEIDWQFWGYAMENQNHLQSGILQNTVSLTAVGVVTGALLVTLAGLQSAKISVSHGEWLMSIIAGTMMGFGAVMASGCNIGAFFSGIASGSLHGWLWLPFALIGNWIGVKLVSSGYK